MYYVSAYTSDDIYHHGIKGQRWGVRRYQNEDGSLTAAGKERLKSLQDDYRDKANKDYEDKKNGIRYLEQQSIDDVYKKYNIDKSVQNLNEMPNEAAQKIISIHNMASTLEAINESVRKKRDEQIDSLDLGEYQQRGKEFLKGAAIGGGIGAATLSSLIAVAGGPLPVIIGAGVTGLLEFGGLSGIIKQATYEDKHPNSVVRLDRYSNR